MLKKIAEFKLKKSLIWIHCVIEPKTI